jgi:predicted amino acid racemase
MTAPRLEIHVDRIRHNASVLVTRLGALGISVTGVTKATMGSPEVAAAMLAAGVRSIGESRIENIEALRRAGLTSHITLIRSPMLSQAERVVTNADVSLNTELDVIERLSSAARAQDRRHGVILMVELGDLREGILPGDLTDAARRTVALPHIELRGIGTNLACQSGVAPDQENMLRLSSLAGVLEQELDLELAVVSGGNSANLDWAFGAPNVGRIDDLRLGESILLGREPLRRTPIDGLHLDAFTLVAEVIESKVKDRSARGELQQTAFGPASSPPVTTGPADSTTNRVIVALGRQDVDPTGLTGPEGMVVIGASSDHLVIDAGSLAPAVGSEIRFQVNYSALMRAVTSPFVDRVFMADVPA